MRSLQRFHVSHLQGSARRSSSTSHDQTLFTAREVTALAASVWIAPLAFAFAGGMWIIRRSDSAEINAKSDRSGMKVLSPEAYAQWRNKDPVLMDFQIAREQLEAFKSGMIHQPPHTYAHFRPSTGKPKEPK